MFGVLRLSAVGVVVGGSGDGVGDGCDDLAESAVLFLVHDVGKSADGSADQDEDDQNQPVVTPVGFHSVPLCEGASMFYCAGREPIMKWIHIY